MRKLFMLIAMGLVISLFSSNMYAWNQCGTGPWVSFNFADGYTVYQDGWGAQNDQSQQLCVNNASNWASSGNFTGGGVKCYPHTQKDVDLAINGNYYCSANFNCSAPNNGTWYNFMFDCWTANMQDELIISEQWNGDAIWGNVVASNVTIGSTSFREVRRANNGSNNVLIFTPYNKRGSGSEDLMAIFTWSKNNGLLVSNTTLHQVSFGVEITYTNGWQSFTCNSFSVSFGQNGGGSGGSNATMQNKATGLYIDGMGRTSNGDNAGQWGGSGSSNQKWTMESTGSNVKFKNVATGLYLDGMGRNSNGSLAGQWSSSGSTNQQWTIETSGSYSRIRNVATGLYLDGMYWSSNGSDLGQWSNSGSDAQLWTITTGLKSAKATEEGISISEQKDIKVQLFPNPFASIINLTINKPEEINRVVIFDLMGTQVETIEKSLITSSLLIGSSLKSGMYIVKVYGTNRTESYKIVKK
jgi:hypothetical protein